MWVAVTDLPTAMTTPLTHPERYPLRSQAQPNKRLQPTKARRRIVKKRASRSRLRG
jgi:hypothetical protein